MRMNVASTSIDYLTFHVQIIEKASSRRLSFLKYGYMYRQELTKGSVPASMQALMILSPPVQAYESEHSSPIFFHSTFFLKKNVLVIHRCKHSDTRMSLPLFSMLLRYNAFTSHDTQLQNRLSILVL